MWSGECKSFSNAGCIISTNKCWDGLSWGELICHKRRLWIRTQKEGFEWVHVIGVCWPDNFTLCAFSAGNAIRSWRWHVFFIELLTNHKYDTEWNSLSEESVNQIHPAQAHLNVDLMEWYCDDWCNPSGVLAITTTHGDIFINERFVNAFILRRFQCFESYWTDFKTSVSPTDITRKFLIENASSSCPLN